MDDAIERLIGWLSGKKADTCGLVHVPKGALIKGKRSVQCGGGQGITSFRESESRKGTILITIEDADLSPQWYISIPAALKNSGVKKIELLSWGWWIAKEPAPEAVWIVDHIACYTPNPLTGTEDAKKGKAFTGMKDAYDESHTMKSGILNEKIQMMDGILWHTRNIEGLLMSEIQIARSSGCIVASPNVVPWAIGARAARCLFAAVIVNPLELQTPLAH